MEEKKLLFIAIIEKLSVKVYRDNDEIVELLDELEDFYSYYLKHEYSTFSDKIFSLEDEATEIMDFNLTEIKKIATINSSLYLDSLVKLSDHINLCIVQKQFIERSMRKVEDEISNAKDSIELFQANTIKELTKFTSEQETKVTDIEQRSNKIYAEFVTILGIFSAIIFAAFGGLEILKNILGNIENVQTGKLLVFSSLTISAIVLLVFILLNGISKLTTMNLRSCGCQGKCSCSFVKKHPTIVVIHVFILFLFILGVSEYFIEYRVVFNDIILNLNSIMIAIAIPLFTLLYFLLAFMIIKFYKKSPKNID